MYKHSGRERFGNFAMRVLQTCHTAYRPYQDLLH
jgi:hypothetical protein